MTRGAGSTHMAEGRESAPRIVLTGGGTGGHVYPALAVAEALGRAVPQVALLYIGGDRIEARVVPATGIPFRSISVHGLAGRGFASLPRRLRSVAELALGIPLLQSLSSLRGFQAHAVVGTGGYVSGPVLLAARLLGVPSIAIEGNRTPGWTSKAAALFVDVVAVADAETGRLLARRAGRHTRVITTGLPIRPELATGDRDGAAAALGLDPDMTTVLVVGGSLGARSINRALLGALAALETREGALDGVQVVHVTGNRDDAIPREPPAPHYHTFRYLGADYAKALAAADLIICRAGASTVAEITARGAPAVLIPWSGASTGEQRMNAEVLARAGAAVVIPDGQLTAERLARTLFELLQDPERRAKMAEASRRLGHPDAADAVARIALELAGRRRQTARLSGRGE